MSDLLHLCWRRYLKSLHDEPLKTKAITAALLAASADIIAQRMGSMRYSKLNWRRTLSIALYGFLWSGPSNHFWQLFLERLFPTKSDTFRPAKKVILDQLTYGPLNNVMFMVFIAKIVEGRSWPTVKAKLAADYPAVQARGWRVWPAAQLFNQAVLPLELRVLWTNAVALIWSTYLILQSKSSGGLAWRLPVRKIA